MTTGHADGLVTLDLAESGDAHREAMRAQMGEPYRTVLGHLRHEVGHHYWTVLAPDEPTRERARALFGDEREDYQAALDRHYVQGPPADWAERHVSAYATMHPAEDWAETFSHYLHIRDTLQTAEAYRITTEIALPGPRTPAPGTMEALIADWLPLSLALNQLNRSMGSDDLYPFVLPPAVMDKLALVHDLAATVTDRELAARRHGCRADRARPPRRRHRRRREGSPDRRRLRGRPRGRGRRDRPDRRRAPRGRLPRRGGSQPLRRADLDRRRPRRHA